MAKTNNCYLKTCASKGFESGSQYSVSAYGDRSRQIFKKMDNIVNPKTGPTMLTDPRVYIIEHWTDGPVVYLYIWNSINISGSVSLWLSV